MGHIYVDPTPRVQAYKNKNIDERQRYYRKMYLDLLPVELKI